MLTLGIGIILSSVGLAITVIPTKVLAVIVTAIGSVGGSFFIFPAIKKFNEQIFNKLVEEKLIEKEKENRNNAEIQNLQSQIETLKSKKFSNMWRNEKNGRLKYHFLLY